MSDKLYKSLPESAVELEEALLVRWDEEGTFQLSLDATRDGERFVFYEGPPTANGRPGIHHILSRTLKDTFGRYHTMKGQYVARMAGWDTHGLPVEVEAEKQLGITGKPEIEKIGIERFTQVCRENVFTYKEEWEKLSQRIGYWLDYSRAYITFTPDYIESEWWALSQFHEKGLLYRGHKVVPFCPRCGTGLSSHEVAQGYRDVTEPAVTVKFPILGRPGEFLLAWTTTPWTLPGNVALAVGPDIHYVKARRDEEVYYLAEVLAPQVLGEDYEIMERISTEELVGLRYEPPFAFLGAALGDGADAWYVTAADFVTADEGTGIVHTAVMYGQDDYELGVRLGLPMHHLVDEEGRFTTDVGPWAGVFVKEADPRIIEALKSSNRLLKVDQHTHTYPFCWRCDTPLLYYARTSWYLRTTAVKDQLIANNASIDWHPPEIGHGRMGQWLASNVDWALSRERYWGTPLPVWLCDRDDSHTEVIGSYAQLAERAGASALGDNFDPHKPGIDEITWGCLQCDGTMHRTPEVIDAWFDSGSMPFAQLHYPFENKERFEVQFPADFIAEGVDQTRGWFYSLLAISTVLFGKSSYKAVVVNDLILDAEGTKMSKSRGNVVDPWAALNEFGADAIRFYLLSVSNPWLPKRYDPSALAEVRRKFFSTLTATYRFFEMYANIEAWHPDVQPPIESRTVMDRWLVSRLDGLIAECNRYMDDYDVTRTVRRISEFVIDDLSNWYVRRSRARFWGTRSASRETMEAAFATLWQAMVTVCRLLAPMAPFTVDWLHRELTAGDSVHLERYPEPQGVRDEGLETVMDVARKLSALGRAAREAAGIRVRQPLRRLYAATEDGQIPVLPQDVLAIARDELNVHEISFIENPGELVSYRAEPNFAVLGPAFGTRAKAVAEAVRALGPEELADWRAAGGELTVQADGVEAALPADGVRLVEEPRQGLAVHSDGVLVVGLDISLDDELLREGTARELVNRIQRLRREAGLEVDDRIRLGIFGAPQVASAAEAHREYILSEVLAVELEVGSRPPDANGYEHVRSVELGGSEAVIGVQVEIRS